MALDKVLSGLGGPLLIGLGVAIAAPVILPMIGSLLRPVAKAAIKGSFYVADTVQGYWPAGEPRVENFVIEAQAEYKAGSAAQA
jgi:hypothetical protein